MWISFKLFIFFLGHFGVSNFQMIQRKIIHWKMIQSLDTCRGVVAFLLTVIAWVRDLFPFSIPFWMQNKRESTMDAKTWIQNRKRWKYSQKVMKSDVNTGWGQIVLPSFMEMILRSGRMSDTYVMTWVKKSNWSSSVLGFFLLWSIRPW